MRQVTGTKAFRAPEMQNEDFYTEAVDLWSVGLVGLMMLGGRKVRTKLLRNRGSLPGQEADSLVTKLLAHEDGFQEAPE